jgi:hypothetical protein
MEPSRLLKNYSPSTGRYVTKKHAGNRRAAESGIQLLFAGGAGAEGPSAARHPGQEEPHIALDSDARIMSLVPGFNEEAANGLT